MSTDVPDGSGPGPTGRRTRAGNGGAPASGALAIVLAIVAVVAGFLILRSINDDDDGDAGETPSGSIDVGDTGTTTSLGLGTTLPPATTTTTEPPLVLDPAVTVIVANASNVNGSAAQMTRALQVVGYTMGDATNKGASVGQLEATVIYFDPAVLNADVVAGSVARSLGGVDSIAPVAVPAPTESGELGGAGVLVMLGVDKAGKTLDELTGAVTADTTATGETSPPVAGDTTGSTAAP
jgi:LytR cell envelope-related transcriptional attenuator